MGVGLHVITCCIVCVHAYDSERERGEKLKGDGKKNPKNDDSSFEHKFLTLRFGLYATQTPAAFCSRRCGSTPYKEISERQSV